MEEKSIRLNESNPSIRSEKLYSVDFLRFIFSMIIVYFHIFHDNIMNFTMAAIFTKSFMKTQTVISLLSVFFC